MGVSAALVRVLCPAVQFPYADAVLKEALRLYPPVPLLAREAKEDTWLGPHFIPKGTWLQVRVWSCACGRQSCACAPGELAYVRSLEA